MSKAESLAVPEPEPGGDVISIRFGESKEAASETQLEIEDRILLDAVGMVSDWHRQFIETKMLEYGANARAVIDATITTYSEVLQLVNDGCRLYYLDRAGQMHPFDSDGDEPQPAV